MASLSGGAHIAIDQDQAEEMQAAQARTFLHWVNLSLKKRGLRVANLYDNLESGVVLIKLMECLAPGKEMPGRYYAKPLINIQKVHNLTVAFKFITKVEKISLNDIKPIDILEKKRDAVHTLIWSLIVRYGIQYHAPTSISKDAEFTAIKRIVLTWINCILTDIRVTNLHTDWRDGSVLSALINYCNPQSMSDQRQLSAQQPYAIVCNAMNLAEKMGIPQLMDVRDFVAEKPDERSVLLYLSHFLPYGQKIFLNWVKTLLPDADLTSFSQDWVDGRLLGALVNAVSGGKHPAHANMNSLDGIANIENGMIAAEKILGVHKTLTPEQFGNASLDLIQRLSYLSQFYRVKIKGSATVLIPPAPDKVQVGQIQVPRTVGDGKSVWVELDCSDAGYGSMRAEVYGKVTGNMPVTVKAVDSEAIAEPNQYHVMFTPSKIDVYTFSVFYTDEHVPGSPFTVNLHPPDPNKVKHLETSLPQKDEKELSMSCDTSNVGHDEMKAHASGEIGGSTPVKVNLESSSMYSVSFSPPLPDIYTMDVLWEKFCANAVGKTSGPMALQVDQDEKHECKVMFKPPAPDVYLADVNWDGKPIPGSPFTIDLLPPAKPEAVECTLPMCTVPGEEVEVLVDASNAGSGELRAYCINTEGGEVHTQVTSLWSGAYQVTFLPRQHDLYKLHITYNNQPVQNSPFVVDLRHGVEQKTGEIDESLYIIQPMPEKCLVRGFGRTVTVNNMVKFTVDVQEAGHGEMDLAITVPSEKPGHHKPTTRVVEVSRGVFNVEFTPTTPGEHGVVVKWAGTKVPGNPFRVKVFEEIAPVPAPEPIKEIDILIGKATKLKVKPQNSTQMNGRLEAEVIGRKTGYQHVEISQDNEGVFLVKFNPTDTDHYVIVMKLNGEEVKTSPFYIHYYLLEQQHVPTVDASKCKILGKESLGEVVDIARKFFLLMDATEAGPDEFVVTPNPPTETVNFSTFETRLLDGETAINKGDHKLNFTWGEDPIPDSPVAVHASDLYGAPQYDFGKSVGADVDMDGKHSDLKLKITHKESGSTEKGELSKVHNGKFQIAFSPKIPGLYFLYLKDKKVASCPYVVQYKRPAMPSEVKVVGLKDATFLGEDIEFTVDATDGGDGKLGVTLLSPDKKVIQPSSMADNKDGTYNICLRPDIAGEHKIYVTWPDKSSPIPGSPFSHNVRDLVGEQLITSLYLKDRVGDREGIQIPGPGQTVKTTVDKTALVTIKALSEEFKKGDLVATAIDVRTRERVNIDVQKDKDKIELTFKPPDPGLYTIDAKLDGNQVPNFPVNLDYHIAAPVASKCRIIGLDDHPATFQVETKIHFQVDTRLAGNGKINIKPESPSGKPTLVARPNHQEKRIIDITYIPNMVGTHKVTLVWSGEQIPRSPLLFHVSPVPEIPYWDLVTFDLEWIDVDESDLLCFFTLDGSDDQQEGRISKVDKNKYIFSFKATEPGLYKLYVNLRGTLTWWSPLSVRYCEPVEEYCEPVEEFDQRSLIEDIMDVFDIDRIIREPPDDITDKKWIRVPIGRTLKLKITPQTKAQRDGELVVKVNGEKGVVETSQDSEGVFHVKFNPSQPDYYIIEVELNGEEVPSSPFYVQYYLDEHSPTPPPRWVEETFGVDIKTDGYKLPYISLWEEEYDFSDQPHKELTAICRGVESGETPVNLYKSSPGSKKYKLKIHPRQPDLYYITIKMDGNEIRISPIKVDLRQTSSEVSERTPIEEHFAATLEDDKVPDYFPTDASKCRIINCKDIPDIVDIGTELAILVDATEAGPGELAVTVDRPTQDNYPSIHSKTGDGALYQVDYTPQTEGQHNLNFMWAGDPIPDSPVIIRVYDLYGAPQYDYGKPIAFETEVDGKQSDLKLKIIHKESGSMVKGKLSKIQKGKFKIAFSPKIPGLYLLHLYLKDKEIRSSPYIVRYKQPVVPSAVKVVGLKDTSFLGDSMEFTVDGTEAGDGKLKVNFLGPDKKERPPSNIKDNGDGTYTVSHHNDVAGDHKIYIKWSNEAIPGCPFSHSVRDLAGEQLITSFYLQDHAGDREEVQFPAHYATVKTTVDKSAVFNVRPLADKLKKGDLVATAVNAKTGERVHIDVQKEKDEFEIGFHTPVPGLYTIDAKLDGNQVPNFPVNLNYHIAAPVASKCRIIGLDDHPATFQVETKIRFQVDTQLAGDGKISIEAESPSGKPTVEARANPLEKHIIDINYMFTVVGTHKVTLLWSGKHIPRSPLWFHVRPVPEIAYGDLVTFDLEWIDVDENDLLCYFILNDSDDQQEGRIRKVNKNKYIFSFKATEPGLYKLYVYLRGILTWWSPLSVRYCELVEEPNQSGIEDIMDKNTFKATEPAPYIMIGKREKKEACERVIREQSNVKIRLIKFNHIGIPRSGKTTFLRRFKGEIENIKKAREKKEPSTGVAEDGGQMLIRYTSSAGVKSTIWSVLQDKGDEADMLTQLFYQLKYSPRTESDDTEDKSTLASSSKIPDIGSSKSSAAISSTEETDNDPNSEDDPNPEDESNPEDDPNPEDILLMLEETLGSRDWDEIKYHLDGLTWLVNTDTGGHSEFLDLQAALIQGPSFNFLYCSLENDLEKPFPVYFTDTDRQSTLTVSSTITTEEVFFQSLASATSYCGSHFDDNAAAPVKLPEYSNSKAMFVATHFDCVTKEVFKAKDELLRQKIESTDFYEKDLVVFASEDQLMVKVDNMTGNQSEIDGIKKKVEKVIEQNFEQISIPASWLVLSLYLRRKNFGTISLKECEEIGKKLKITPDNLQHALWFLHHSVGLLLYYPEVEELKDLVICDPLLVYDSTSNLIKNASLFEKVGQRAWRDFTDKAQISLKDVRKAMKSSNSKITPEKLVKLLKHINILSLRYTEKQNLIYFMPSLLKSAKTVELAAPPSSESDPAPLMICYDCGYIPLGLFPSIIANLLSQQLKDWKIIEEGLCKNRIQFYVGKDLDTITLLSYPQYIEIAISRKENFETSTGVLCTHVRSTIQSTLLSVTKCMNHKFNMGYKFGFECPNHPQRLHLCMLAHNASDEEANKSARNMCCLENPKKPEPLPLQSEHKVWFEQEHLFGQEISPEKVCPSLKVLIRLKWKDEHGNKQIFRLRDKVSAKWGDFGLCLGFSMNRITALKREHSSNCDECWNTVMDHWLNEGHEDYPVSWQGLCSLLEDVDCPGVAEELEKAVAAFC